MYIDKTIGSLREEQAQTVDMAIDLLADEVSAQLDREPADIRAKILHRLMAKYHVACGTIKEGGYCPRCDQGNKP